MITYISGARRNVDLIIENFYTVWVRLANGDIIKRHKGKHFDNFEIDKQPKIQVEKPPEIIIQRKVTFWNRLVDAIKLGIKFLKGNK